MKKIILLLSLFSTIYNPVFCQQYKDKEFCEFWQIAPVLYNNVVSDSEIVKYWENYWYYRSNERYQFVPDTLKVEFGLVPSMEILPKVEVPNSVYTIFSTLQFKYGDGQDSYNVINPKLSDTIVLLNQDINLKEIYLKIFEDSMMGKSFYSKSIPLIENLSRLNIHLEIGPWDYNKSRPLYLNQIVIKTYFIDINGDIKCSSEFIFPINGAYLSGNCCKDEF